MMTKKTKVWVAFVLACSSSLSIAEIAFEDVTGKAGIDHRGPTYGASWGDFNGDGWPDIWVGNHLIDRNRPTLYLNQRNGTFRDVTDSVVTVDPRADLHGAAWSDFDNDGDQDLLATAGGGGGIDEAEGPHDNHLFVNTGGRLTDEAARLGLLDPQGRGRSALWLDADRDGLLDVLFVNYPRPDGKAPPAIYHQTGNGFVSANPLFGFVHTPLSRKEKLLDLLDNAVHLRLRHRRARLDANEFAQIAQLDGEGAAELLAYLAPLRIFSVASVPFEDITNRFTLPDYRDVRDVAVEDFDGNGTSDLYLARAIPSTSWTHGSDIVLSGSQDVRGRMVRAGKAKAPLATRFRTQGTVTIGLYPPWINPVIPDTEKPQLVIGGQRRTLAGPVSVRLIPSDPRLAGPTPSTPMEQNVLMVRYEPQSSTWTLASTVPRINFVVHSDRALEQITPDGFIPSKGALPDALLLQQDRSAFVERRGMAVSACHSVAAGDFDNDMDTDLYLVCTGPIENLPNVLLENQGQGRLVAVPDAGGAAGTREGRGDAVVSADYDRDGFLDLFVTNGGDLAPFADLGPYQLFHNRGNGNHWLEIDLQGTKSNRDGIGATVTVEAGGTRLMRTQGGGMHHHAQNDKRLHFGLRDQTAVTRITVRWPSGAVQTLREVRADRVLLIKETPDPEPTRPSASASLDVP